MSQGAARVRVLVADDHPVFREGIVRAIKDRPELELVGEAADGREALDMVRRLDPDVAVLDVKMPGLDGIQVVNAITRDGLRTRVVLLSAFVEGEVVYGAISSGAAGYLSKDADRQRICEAVSAVARGETVLSPEIQAGIAEQIRARGGDAPPLSARERQVLELIAEGLTVAEIGERIHLSPGTIKSHLQSLYEKLGVSDRAAAVATAMRRGLLE